MTMRLNLKFKRGSLTGLVIWLLCGPPLSTQFAQVMSAVSRPILANILGHEPESFHKTIASMALT